MQDIENLRRQMAAWCDQVRAVKLENMAIRVLINALIDSHPNPSVLELSLTRAHELFVANALCSSLADEDREKLADHLCDLIDAVRERSTA